jgi:hypothetical protein
MLIKSAEGLCRLESAKGKEKVGVFLLFLAKSRRIYDLQPATLYWAEKGKAGPYID